jgi:hypothetical protein
VAALPWNQWQASSGITGNLGLEYADKRLDLTLEEGRGRFVLNTDTFKKEAECPLCDLSVPCFRIADRVNPYLIKDRFYQKAAKIWFQYLQLW